MRKLLPSIMLLAVAVPVFCCCSKDNEEEKIIDKNQEVGLKEITVENTYWVSEKMIEDFGRNLPAFYIDFQSKVKCMVYEFQSPGSDHPGYMVGSPLDYTRSNNTLSFVEDYWDTSTDPGKWIKREYASCSINNDKELTFIYQGKSYRMIKTTNTIDSYNK